MVCIWGALCRLLRLREFVRLEAVPSNVIGGKYGLFEFVFAGFVVVGLLLHHPIDLADCYTGLLTAVIPVAWICGVLGWRDVRFYCLPHRLHVATALIIFTDITIRRIRPFPNKRLSRDGRTLWSCDAWIPFACSTLLTPLALSNRRRRTYVIVPQQPLLGIYKRRCCSCVERDQIYLIPQVLFHTLSTSSASRFGRFCTRGLRGHYAGLLRPL